MSIRLGDVPSWISAMGSLFALAFAAWAVMAARRTFRIESKRDQQADEERFRSQAALVSTWWGRDPTTDQWGVFVRNASGTPIYQAYLNVLNANDSRDLPFARIHHFVVAPSVDAIFSPIALPPGVDNSDVRVELHLTDAAGIRWQRNRFGRLSELQPSLRVKLYEARAAVLTEFEDDFRGTYGVDITFDTDTDVISQTEFRTQVLPASKGVPQPVSIRHSRFDAMVCPHDWLGDFFERGVIDPVVLSADQTAKLTPWMLAAASLEGRLLGVPMVTDTVALIRNTRLVPDKPASFNDLIARGLALRDAGRVTHVFALRVGPTGDPFQVWPLFASAGGWLFRRQPSGTWDPTVVGLDTKEGVAAFERLRELGESGTGMLQRSVGRVQALKLFTSQHTAFLVSGSDALGPIRRAGLPIEVSEVPPFLGGKPATPFTLVQCACVARQGQNKSIGADLFADYLTHERIMRALTEGIDSPTALTTLVPKDPHVKSYRDLCEHGVPMPALAQMERVWRILEHAEIQALTGSPSRQIAKEAAAAVKTLFA